LFSFHRRVVNIILLLFFVYTLEIILSMKNNIENLNNLELLTNLNQSFNENKKHKKFLSQINKSFISIICLIIFPIIFIIIGIIYRNSCVAKPDIPIFLIIFGILILINLFIYIIIGTTFLACKIFSFRISFFMKIDF